MPKIRRRPLMFIIRFLYPTTDCPSPPKKTQAKRFTWTVAAPPPIGQCRFYLPTAIFPAAGGTDPQLARQRFERSPSGDQQIHAVPPEFLVVSSR